MPIGVVISPILKKLKYLLASAHVHAYSARLVEGNSTDEKPETEPKMLKIQQFTGARVEATREMVD